MNFFFQMNDLEASPYTSMIIKLMIIEDPLSNMQRAIEFYTKVCDSIAKAAASLRKA
jgi:hypothetical protein